MFHRQKGTLVRNMDTSWLMRIFIKTHDKSAHSSDRSPRGIMMLTFG